MFSIIKKALISHLNKNYPGQRIDVALRERAVVNIIKKSGLINPKILEIGPGASGISRYLEGNVESIDAEPASDDVSMGDAAAIGLPDKSFDVVVSIDMIEHLSKQKRKQAISEMMRMAKKKIILAVPCGKKARKFDDMVDRAYRKTKGESYRWLDEHVKNGLPLSDEIVKIINDFSGKLGRPIKVRLKKNINVYVWYFLRRLWSSKYKFLNKIEHPAALLFYPILKHMNFGPCYRTIFEIDYILTKGEHA